MHVIRYSPARSIRGSSVDFGSHRKGDTSRPLDAKLLASERVILVFAEPCFSKASAYFPSGHDTRTTPSSVGGLEPGGPRGSKGTDLQVYVYSRQLNLRA